MATFGACAELHRHASTFGAGLGAICFCAQTRQDDDLSGEPPSTAYIIGQFQYLKSLSHPNLCEYVEIINGKRARLFVVSEHYNCNLQQIFQDHDKDASSKGVDIPRLRKWAGQILDGLTYLHDHGILHRSMTLSNVLLNLEGDIKLSNYGLYNMTKDGTLVEFNIGDPHYLSPRTLTWAEQPPLAFRDASVDVWSLGVMMVELLLGEKFWQKERSDLDELIASLFSIRVLAVKEKDWIQACYSQPDRHPAIGINPVVLEYLATGRLCGETMDGDVGSKEQQQQQQQQQIHDFICRCLCLSADRIKDIHQIRKHEFLQSHDFQLEDMLNLDDSMLASSLSLSLLSSTLPNLEGRVERLRRELQESQEHLTDDSHDGSKARRDNGFASGSNNLEKRRRLDKMPLSQVFYLWRLAGGDVEVQFRKNGRLIGTPTIQLLPTIVQVGDDAKGTKGATAGSINSNGSNGSGEHSQSSHSHAHPNNPSQDSKNGVAGRRRDIVISDPANLFSDKPCILPLDGLETEIERSIHEPNKNQFAWDTDYFLFTDPDEMNFLIDTMSPVSDGRGLLYPDAGARVAVGEGVAPARGVAALESGGVGENRATSGGGMVGSSVTPPGSNSLLSMHGASAPLAQQPSKTRTKVPLSIREKDLGYQYQRLSMFTDLLLQYPASREEILHHAKVDIPPLLRGKVWAAILGVIGNYWALYNSFDKSSDRPTDRQIERDVPRCHQYNQLMFSQAGREKMTRILKTWIEANEHQAYWQGLDSCCAPFLTLNFNDEALVFACVQEFLPKYLKDIFLHDNSKIIHEYLAVFRHMLSFHDPELSAHLDHIQFVPQIYAVSWYMTLFAHIFSLDKIYHLWDKILVGPSSLPLFVGIAILQNARHDLLRSEFNEAVGFSSSVPGTDIEKCMEAALAMCRATPPSTCWLSYDAESRQQRAAAAAAESSGASANGGGKGFLNVGAAAGEASEHETSNVGVAAAGTGTGARRSSLEVGKNHPESYWWEEPLSLEVLNAELAPRIHRSDLFRLRQQVLVIDIRPESEYTSGHYPSSIHLVPGHLELLIQVLKMIVKKKYVVILASKGDSGPEFASALVRAGFYRVAVLMGGIDALRIHAGNVPTSLSRQRSASSSLASSGISPTLAATSTTTSTTGAPTTPSSALGSTTAAAAATASPPVVSICSCVVHRQKITVPTRIKDEVLILKCKTPITNRKQRG